MKQHDYQPTGAILFVVALLAAGGGCDEASSAGESMPSSATTSPTSTSASGVTSANALPFAGSFHTTYQGSQSILKLEQSGSKLSGTIDGAILAGHADANTARGDLKDPQNNQIGGTFELTRRGDELDLKLTLRDAESGQTLTLPTITYKSGQPPPVSVQLDPQLVGRWRYTSTYVSGDFSAASDTWLILNPDGTFEYGYGRVGAGGSSASIVTDRGDAETGKWRAEDRVLMYQGTGSAAWQPFARYYVEGNNMMLTYDNGKRQVWERQ
jgi:hypothetical protein